MDRSGSAGTLGLLAAWLATLDRRAQLQRGTWVLVGRELASAAAALRHVGERAARWATTGPPHGAATSG